MKTRCSNQLSITWILLTLMGIGWGALAHAEPHFPARERLYVLLIGPPHGYDGKSAAECTLLESLTDVRFSVVPVPHDAGGGS